jgi:glycosyltransferase involved in cell wall biosynthesis
VTRPLRITVVSNFMPPHLGGIETMAALLCDGLAEAGHAVRWVASAEPAPPGRDDRVTRLPAWNPLEARIHVPLPIWGPRAVARLAADIRTADVVHVHECVNISSWDAIAAAKALGKPVVLTQHVGFVPYGGALDHVQRLAYRTAGRIALGRVDARVAVSPHVAAWFADQRFAPPFEWVPNARDERMYRPATAEARAAARVALGDPERVVLFAARLVPKKGVDAVVAAWPNVARRNPGWRLVVAGAGPLEGRFGGLPATRMLGQQSQSAMPALYAAADAYWLPSHGEGFPLTVQEAMLSDVPVVVSDDPSFRANLAGAPGVTILAPEDDVTRALEAAVCAPRDGQVAAWAVARWARATMVERYVAIYERVLGVHRRGAGAAHLR